MRLLRVKRAAVQTTLTDTIKDIWTYRMNVESLPVRVDICAIPNLAASLRPEEHETHLRGIIENLLTNVET